MHHVEHCRTIMACRKRNCNKIVIQKFAAKVKPNANVNVRGILTVRFVNCNCKGLGFIHQLRIILESNGTNVANVVRHDQVIAIAELDTTTHHFCILNCKCCSTKRKPSFHNKCG